MKWIKKLLTSLLVLASTQFAWAEIDKAENLPSPPKTTIIRGEISYIEEINMGPKATALWKEVQALGAAPDLRDFSRLKKAFQLTDADSENEIDLGKMKSQTKTGLHGANGLIKKWRYGIGIPIFEPREPFLMFEITFDMSNICLSKLEIQRIYGKGQEDYPIDAPNTGQSDQTGYSHGLSIPPHPGGFEIAPNGCARNFSTGHALH